MTNPTDTNQASELYELCKEVYKRTGWNDSRLLDFCTIRMYESEELGTTVTEHGRVPLYTSDYLLEKLPSPLIFHNNDCAIEVRRTKKDKYMWSANIRHSYGQFFKQLSDTPLKALLKLCLALHKEGVL